MGLFFATVGMQLELRVLFEYWYWIILGVALLMVTKVVLVRISASLFAMSSVDAWSAGIKLCQVGEFSFVIAALANTHGVITPTQSSVIVCIGVISMALTPYLIERSLEIAQWLAPDKRALHTLEQPVFEAEDIREHVVICGFGRVGQSVARMLDMEDVEYVVVDVDPIRVHESRSAGEPVIFGDATQKDILLNAGIADAKLVLITFSDAEQAKLVIDAARQCREDIDVMVRTHRDAELDALYKAGASQVVPELQEGSLMLITQVMHYAGIPMSRILRRVREERKGRYDHLHGFYPGETTEISYGTADKLEFIHAVVLGADAFAIGKTIAELGKLTEKVKIKSIRRGTVDWDPADWHQALASGDVVVVAGKPRRVERAERYLLEGD